MTAEPIAAPTPVLEARRRLTDAMHATHCDQRIRVDLALARELAAAWDGYDAALLRANVPMLRAIAVELRDALAAVHPIRGAGHGDGAACGTCATIAQATLTLNRPGEAVSQ